MTSNKKIWSNISKATSLEEIERDPFLYFLFFSFLFQDFKKLSLLSYRERRRWQWGDITREMWAMVVVRVEEGHTRWCCWLHLGRRWLGWWCFTSSERGGSSAFFSKRKIISSCLFSFSCRSTPLSLSLSLSLICITSTCHAPSTPRMN